MHRGPEKLSGKRYNPVGIPGAVLFRQRRDHHHRQAYLRRPIHQLCWCNHSPFRHRHPRHSTRRDALRRWRKGLHVISGFPAVVGVHEGVRPVQAFEVDEVIVGTVSCHHKPSLVKQVSTVQLVRIEFCDGLTHPVRQQDPTVGGRQLVGVPLFHVVALLIPRLESLLHPQLDQPPVSCIDRLHLIRAPWSQQPKQSVANLLEFFLELFWRLSVQIVGERMDCSAGFTPEPPVTAALKALSTQQLHYSLSTQAQPWNWTSTPECHTAFSTWLVRFPVPRKMMPGLYQFRGQQVGDYFVLL